VTPLFHFTLHFFLQYMTRYKIYLSVRRSMYVCMNKLFLRNGWTATPFAMFVVQHFLLERTLRNSAKVIYISVIRCINRDHTESGIKNTVQFFRLTHL